MKNFIKRFISLQGLMIFLGFAVISLLTCSQQVSAREQQKLPYLIKVNRSHNTVTIYEKDSNGEYITPMKAMVCSVGARGLTKVGTFQTKAKYRWKLLMGNVWGQYSTRIVGGILFHSVYYYENGNPATLATSEYNKLGTAASHGCIRLTVEDAKWIYDHCDVGTTVIVYDDAKNPGPLGKPEGIKIPATVRWDPTDPSKNNPYIDSLPTITGAKNVATDYGVTFDLLKGITAKSSLGANITSKLTVIGKVDYYVAGDYEITYEVTDTIGLSIAKTITVTVKECLVDPELVGVSDKLVNGTTTINEAFALKGIEAIRGDLKLEKSLIKVTIIKINEDDYKLTYHVNINGKTAAEQAFVHVDPEAPVIMGNKDFLLEEGEIPDMDYLLSEIKVIDNYSKLENIEISVIVNDHPKGGYVVTYKAVDEAGNITQEQSEIIY